jgi:hypothetical protein
MGSAAHATPPAVIDAATVNPNNRVIDIVSSPKSRLHPLLVLFGDLAASLDALLTQIYTSDYLWPTPLLLHKHALNLMRRVNSGKSRTVSMRFCRKSRR